MPFSFYLIRVDKSYIIKYIGYIEIWDILKSAWAAAELQIRRLFLSGTGGEKLYRDFTIQVCRISYYPAIIPHKEERK